MSNNFRSGFAGKRNWASVCDRCEHLERKKSVGCEPSGCDKTTLAIIGHPRNELYHTMQCWHCNQTVKVDVSDGFWCRLCGLGCSYAMSVTLTQARGKALSVVDGFLDADIVDDVDFSKARRMKPVKKQEKKIDR